MVLAQDLYARGVKCVGEGERDARSLSHVAHQGGAETGDAGAASVANAGIDYSRRALVEQTAAELLGRMIAVRIEVLFVSGVFAWSRAARIIIS